MKKFAYLLSTLLVVFMFTSCEKGIDSPAKELFDGFVEPCTNWGCSKNEVNVYMSNLGVNYKGDDTFGSYENTIDGFGYIYFEGEKYENKENENTLRASFVSTSIDLQTLTSNFNKKYKEVGVYVDVEGEDSYKTKTYYEIYTKKDLTVLVPTKVRVEIDGVEQKPEIGEGEKEENVVAYFPGMNGKTAEEIVAAIEIYMDVK